MIFAVYLYRNLMLRNGDLYDEDILDESDIGIIQNSSKDNEKDDFER